MKNEVKEIIEMGKKYIIPERFNEWIDVCRVNCDSDNGLSVMKEIVGIIAVLSTTRLSMSQIARQFSFNSYDEDEWRWIEKQIVRFSSKGYNFAMRTKNEKSPEVIEELEKLNEENKHFSSQINKGMHI